MTAEDIIRVKELLPTTLGSVEIRDAFPRELLERAIFSARMASVSYLADVRDVCARMMSGEISEAAARDVLGGVLERMGHSPQDEGGLSNPASIRRLNLILETQTQMAASVAVLQEQTAATVGIWPAWELTRLEGRSAPREDWPQRWNAAGEAVGWDGAARGGRFVALKASPIWQALGDGAGGFKDTLGNPYPPFAFSSGMGWEDVGREECERLGLLAPGEEPPRPAGVSLAPDAEELRRVVESCGFDISEGL